MWQRLIIEYRRSTHYQTVRRRRRRDVAVEPQAETGDVNTSEVYHYASGLV